MLEAYIDGACEPKNPGGTASYGIVVQENGQAVWEEGKVVGSGPKMSNNVGEYSAVVALLEWYVQTGQTQKLLVRSDSQLVVNQLQGNWRTSSSKLYYPYFVKAERLVQKVPCTFIWIPREENTKADSLSKQALERVGIKPRRR